MDVCVLEERPGCIYNRAVFIFLASGTWAAVIKVFLRGFRGNRQLLSTHIPPFLSQPRFLARYARKDFDKNIVIPQDSGK